MCILHWLIYKYFKCIRYTSKFRHVVMFLINIENVFYTEIVKLR
jgi:hypothetical protein